MESTAVILARVSTEEQGRKGYSIQEQLIACRERAQELGATRILEFVDEESGDFLDRPGLTAAREAVRTGRVRWFICYDPDRFSRTLMNQLLVADEIERAGTELVFIAHNYERTPEGQLFFQLRGAIAQFEKAKILERTQRGKRGKLRAGLLPLGLRTTGYRFIKEQGRIEIDEAQAAIVRRIFDMFTKQGMSIRAIVAHLNATGTPSPGGKGQWYRATVTRILRNPTYCGTFYAYRYDTQKSHLRRRAGEQVVRRRPKSEWVPVKVPAIISEEQFELAQSILARSGHQREASDGRAHLLSGMMTCGLCGGPVRYKNNSKWTRYLACSRRFEYRDLKLENQFSCSLPYIKAAPVEQHVKDVVRAWITDPRLLREALEERSSYREQHRPAEQELAELTANIERLEGERERLANLVVKGLVNMDSGEKKLAELTERISRMEARRSELSKLIKRAPSPAERMEELEETLNRLRDLWDSLTDQEQRPFVKALVARVIIGGKTPDTWQVVPLEG